MTEAVGSARYFHFLPAVEVRFFKKGARFDVTSTVSIALHLAGPLRLR